MGRSLSVSRSPSNHGQSRRIHPGPASMRILLPFHFPATDSPNLQGQKTARLAEHAVHLARTQRMVEIQRTFLGCQDDGQNNKNRCFRSHIFSETAAMIKARPRTHRYPHLPLYAKVHLPLSLDFRLIRHPWLVARPEEMASPHHQVHRRHELSFKNPMHRRLQHYLGHSPGIAVHHPLQGHISV